jgi:hypothetical protein
MNVVGRRCRSDKHHLHLCSLKALGATATVARLTSRPTVKCSICGAEADSEENVCKPVMLPHEEQAG